MCTFETRGEYAQARWWVKTNGGTDDLDGTSGNASVRKIRNEAGDKSVQVGWDGALGWIPWPTELGFGPVDGDVVAFEVCEEACSRTDGLDGVPSNGEVIDDGCGDRGVRGWGGWVVVREDW